MRQTWQTEAEEHLKNGRHKRIWNKVVRTLACIVVFCTTYALILPAITMERRTYCGQEAHVHDENCGSESISWSCGEQWQTHTHRAACFDAEGNLVCGESDVLLHTHNTYCYNEDGALVCPLTATAEHVHGDGCYATVRGELLCELEEDPGHSHTDDCYDEAGELICGETAREGHTHGDECFVCTKELRCTRDEAVEHEHSEDCYAADGTLLCAIPAAQRHDHDENCLCTVTAEECDIPEHTHTLACYSDPEADVETASDWRSSVASADLDGTAAERLLAVAETQLGYRESTKNYTVLADGETTRGYTRYGAWYGDPYGDWCAMFVSFCLHYADVETLGRDASCGSWMADLAANGLVSAAESAIPAPGDLVFIDTDGDRAADHMGIVTGWADGTLTTIEGNRSDSVCRMSYDTDDAALLGYASLGDAEESGEAEQVMRLIDVLPTAEELTAAAEDLDDDAAEDYLTEIYLDVLAAKEAYEALSAAQQARVVNAEKLTALLALWPESGTLNENFEFEKPTTVQSASTKDFIDLNLYDYNGYINDRYDNDKKYPGFQWNGGAYMYSNTFNRHSVDYIDFGNSNITDRQYGGSGTSIANGKSANAVIAGVLYTNDSAKNTGAINRLWWDGSKNASITNRPVGMSTDIEALSRNLGSDGYPALSDNTSLGYLFTDDNYSVFKQNTQSIDGLFQKDEKSGAYYYNSRENHAQYSNNTFTLYDQIITPNFIVYPFGNFLPFNTITDSTKATQVSSINNVNTYIDKLIADMAGSLSGSPTKTQLTEMLKKYKASNTTNNITTAKQAITDYLIGGGTTSKDLISDAQVNRLYNIDWDEETNFFFGMDMTMNFFQPKGGMTGNDTNNDGTPDYPMEFYFTGDDDVWVYIDGVLFLDLTGIHRHVGGKIDFVNGKVEYYELDTAGTGDVSGTPYKTYTFAQLLQAAGKSTDGLNEKGTFKDYSTHTFKFYYMERGSGSSVCRMNFNFPLLRQHSITVTKELSSDVPVLGDPDFKFQVLKENGTELFITAGTEYEILNAAGETIGTGVTDTNGVFTLKAGQTAVFTGIRENTGKYIVRELLDDSFAQYGKITVNGSSATESYGVAVGESTFTGLSSPVQDVSNGSTAFRFDNHISAEKSDQLGKLSITKVLEDYPQGARAAPQFSFEVMLDGQPLPKDTKYTVTTADSTVERTVTQAGIVTLAPGETATIDNILIGTEFTVTETEASAKDYAVTYTVGDTTTNDKASGRIGVKSTVAVTVKNAEKGATVEIPVTKTLLTPDGKEHSYTFALTEVTDSSGGTVKEGGTAATLTLAITKDAVTNNFVIAYPASKLETLPATFYYRITEKITEDDPTADGGTIFDNAVYIVEVTVRKGDGGDPAAEVTAIWKDGTKLENGAVAFTNQIRRYELPETGGPGSTLFTFCGVCLTAAAVLILCARGRRKERGTE